MNRLIVPAVLFFCFLLESVFADLIEPVWFELEYMVIPRFTLITLILSAVFYDRVKTISLGIFFGFLVDLIYTDILGIYLFLFPLMVYLTSKAVKFVEPNILIMLVIATVEIICLEGFLYGLYYLIGSTSIQPDQFVDLRLIPSLLINGVFIVIIFYPLRKLLKKLAINTKM